MDAFTPLVNLFAILTALSLAAERITNIVKLRSRDLRDKARDEKDRERQITNRALLVSLAVALLVKADFFEILSRLDAPWETLGWARMQAGELVRSSAVSGVGRFIYAVTGCLLTGCAMGFGSRFWHDVLGVLLDTRKKIKRSAGVLDG
jgi:hypothetical protein